MDSNGLKRTLKHIGQSYIYKQNKPRFVLPKKPSNSSLQKCLERIHYLDIWNYLQKKIQTCRKLITSNIFTKWTVAKKRLTRVSKRILWETLQFYGQQKEYVDRESSEQSLKHTENCRDYLH